MLRAGELIDDGGHELVEIGARLRAAQRPIRAGLPSAHRIGNLGRLAEAHMRQPLKRLRRVLGPAFAVERKGKLAGYTLGRAFEQPHIMVLYPSHMAKERACEIIAVAEAKKAREHRSEE